MSANVAKITEPKEKGRWEPNRHLWKTANEMAGVRRSLMGKMGENR
ncbi:MAG: hypothetical protein ABI442_16110 [Gemmatimonadaceae bacterium]